MSLYNFPNKKISIKREENYLFFNNKKKFQSKDEFVINKINNKYNIFMFEDYYKLYLKNILKFHGISNYKLYKVKMINYSISDLIQNNEYVMISFEKNYLLNQNNIQKLIKKNNRFENKEIIKFISEIEKNFIDYLNLENFYYLNYLNNIVIFRENLIRLDIINDKYNKDVSTEFNDKFLLYNKNINNIDLKYYHNKNTYLKQLITKERHILKQLIYKNKNIEIDYNSFKLKYNIENININDIFNNKIINKVKKYNKNIKNNLFIIKIKYKNNNYFGNISLTDKNREYNIYTNDKKSFFSINLRVHGKDVEIIYNSKIYLFKNGFFNKDIEDFEVQIFNTNF